MSDRYRRALPVAPELSARVKKYVARVGFGVAAQRLGVGSATLHQARGTGALEPGTVDRIASRLDAEEVAARRAQGRSDEKGLEK
jgi:hypothetical protein